MILKNEKLSAFPLKTGKRARMSITTSFNIILNALIIAICRQIQCKHIRQKTKGSGTVALALIPAAQEAETRRITFQGQPRQIISKTPSE
jgi:hypothetical protein